MATINATLPTLKDIAARMDPHGGIASIVEVLARQNPLLEGMVWKEGNLPTGHVITSADGAPLRHLAALQRGRLAAEVHHGPGDRDVRHARGPVED
jgi:hypothetical protein